MKDSAFMVLTGRESVAANLFSRGIEDPGTAVEGTLHIVYGIGSIGTRDSAFLFLT
jgi:hypothetical protein